MNPRSSLCVLRPIPPRSLHRLFSTSHPRPSDRQIRIVEVGPRDGLQNEKQSIPVATKIELTRRLATTGLDCIEAGSFVAPKWVPQMAASNEILEHILHTPPQSPRPISYQWLLPNMKGLDNFFSTISSASPSSSSSAAAEASPAPNTSSADANAHPGTYGGASALHHPTPPHEVSLFMAATESFSHRNTNCSIADSLTRFRPLVARAKAAAHPVRAYISVALGCPYEGPDVDPHRVAELAAALLELGADEVCVADTTGMGTAPRTRALLRTLRDAGIRSEDLALHFHDTFGQALVNTLVSLEFGVRTFDAAVAGLGGCPYSPGATGNVATEDLVYLLHGLGLETGVDLERMAEIGEWISGVLGRENGSRAGKATLARSRMEAKERTAKL